MKRFVTLVALTVAMSALAVDASAQEFQVVVNAASGVTELTRDQVSDIFRKKARRLGGESAEPVDLNKNLAAREAFSQAVHGSSVNSIVSWWMQQVFAGKDDPPDQMGSEAELLEFVRSNPGAIGYVSAGADLGSGVKAIQVTGL
jgi:ABC-type phosphate transport system substrate-binding protein